MPTREFKGKTIDLAISAGLDAMGLSLDEVSMEIVSDGSGGFLGMKKACVRMTPKAELSEEDLKEEEELMRKAEEELEKERKEREKEHFTTNYRKDGRGRSRNKNQKPREKREPVVVEPPVYEDAETPCKAEPFLKEVLRIMEVDATCKSIKSDAEKTECMLIAGADAALLIGRRGDTLDAIQYLCSLVANKGEKEYTRITIDTENYRKKREATLSSLAKRMAGKVAKTGREIKLEPMNPYERRILHYTLQSNPKVETISEGEDPFRCVIIRPKEK